MSASTEHHAMIDETCKRLFSDNRMPIYHLLKKQLIEFHIGHAAYHLEIKILPCIIAFIITS